MRVVSLGSFYDYQINLANALSQKGHRVLLPASTALPESDLTPIDKEVELYLFGPPKSLTHLISHPFIFAQFAMKIKQFKPDIIHLQMGVISITSFILLLFLKFLKGLPLVATFHDVEIHLGENRGWWGEFNRHQLSVFCDEVIVHGEELREQMMRYHNIPGERVHAIPMGEHQVAPFTRYEREGVSEDGSLVLFFGRIYEYKGLEYLIKAEPIITREVPGAKIVIAGAGENFEKYEMMMGQRKDNFMVHNYRIPYQEGAELFQRCSLVVLPYIDASQSGVVITAYGFKKPVVVTNVGSLPEIVDEGKTGFIVPPRNPEALAEAVVRLLRDKDLRKKMGENAYHKLKTDLSWDRITEKTVEVYEKARRHRRKA